MNDKDETILVWVAGFSGVFLLYSAYKGKSPLATLNAYLSGGATTSTSSSAAPFTGSASVDQPAPPVTGSASVDQTAKGVTTDSYSVGQIGDGSSTYYTLDSNGNPVSQIPSVYQTSPNSYIPGNTS
jgi:hypothetical protein